MKVVLLAGGQSTRLEPISDKILLNFCGKTLLEHQLERLRNAKLNQFIIVGNCFNLARIKEICSHLPGNFEFAEQIDLTTGMAGCILAAESLIAANEEILIVSTNDFVEENAYCLILEGIHRHPQASLLLGKRVKNYFPGGYLKINSDNQIEDIIEKPEAGAEPSDLINLVVHYHYNAQLFFAELKLKIFSKNDDLYEAAISRQIKKGVKYFVIPYYGFWQAIKYPWHILDLQKYFLENLHSHTDSSIEIGKNVCIKGHVYFGKNVKIYENSIINGPVYLGNNCIVANNCLVRQSIIGENSVIGFSSEIARSFLHGKIWTHSNYLGDSILDTNVSLGAGSVTGNLRFDEKEILVKIKEQKINCGKNKLGAIIGANVCIGINVSLMPGIKIGANSLIGPGVVLNEDLPINSYLKSDLKNSQIVSNNLPNNQPNRGNFFQQL